MYLKVDVLWVELGNSDAELELRGAAEGEEHLTSIGDRHRQVAQTLAQLLGEYPRFVLHSVTGKWNI